MSITMLELFYDFIERIGYKLRFWAWHRKLKRKLKK